MPPERRTTAAQVRHLAERLSNRPALEQADPRTGRHPTVMVRGVSSACNAAQCALCHCL